MKKTFTKSILLVTAVCLSLCVNSAFAQTVTVNATDLVIGLSSSPLLGGSTTRVVFGFQLDKTGATCSVNQIVVNVLNSTSNPTDPTTSLLSANLHLSTNSDWGGSEPVVATGVLNNSGATPANSIVFSGSPIHNFAGTGAATAYFFVVVTVKSTTNSTPTAPAIKLSLPNTGITLSAGSTTASSTEGNLYSFQALEIPIVQHTGSIATALVSGKTQKAILAFRATTTGTQALTTAVFTLNIDPTDATLLKNYKIINNGASSTYSGGGTAVGTPIANGPAKTLTFNSINVAQSSINNYFFLVADVDATVTSGDGSVTAELTSASANVGLVSGTPFSQTAIPFAALSATLTEITTTPVVTTVLEAASTDAVLAGFSMTSNDEQTLNQLDFNISNGAGKLSNYKLYSTTTPGVLGSLVASSASGSFTGLTEIVTTSTTYFYLTANVNASVTTATPTALVTLTQANVTLDGGLKTALNISRTLSFTQSNAIIAVASAGQPTIDITEYDDETETVLANITSSNSEAIFSISITDGDIDGNPTTITQLNFNVTQFDNLATISLFDGSTKIASQAISGSGTINFMGLNYVIGDGTVGIPTVKTLDVRVTFGVHVTDHDIIGVELTGATSLPTGSGIAAFSNIKTGASSNTVDVDATKLIFVNPPSPVPPIVAYTGPLTVTPSPQAGSAFSVTVWAVDAYNNLDVDINASITLSATGGSGSLSGTTTQNLVGGVRTYSSLSVSAPDAYDLNASDGSSLTDANSANGGTNIDLIVASLGTSVTKANLATCKVGLGNYFTALPNLVLTEEDGTDFKTGTNLTFLLILPSGWEFLTPTTTTPTPAYSAPTVSYTAARNFTAATFTGFIGTTIARFTYSVAGGTPLKDALTISGLYVKNVDGIATAEIYRSGTGVITGADETKSMGTLTTNSSATVVNFGVQELPGNPSVPPTQTSFNISSQAVKLVGAPPGGMFSGNAVIVSGADGYTFNPATIGVGSYPITYTYTEPAGQHCKIEITKNLTVIANYINGLLNSYCTSGTPSAISVPQSTIDQHFGGSSVYVFHEFVYYEPAMSAFTVMPGPNTTFNPANPAFDRTINDNGTVYIGYRVRNSSTSVVLPDGFFYENIHFIAIGVTRSPILAFNLPSMVCVNANSIDLDNLVVPTPVVPANDNFSGTSVSSPSTNQWEFRPNTVPGANSSQQNVNITYQYKDPRTLCSSTVTKSITVYPTPAQVASNVISPSTTIEVCQGENMGTYNATPVVGVTYRWYSDNSLTTLVGQGPTFKPDILTATASTTDFYVTQTVNNCESPLSRQVSAVVNPIPAAPGIDFTRGYCLNSAIPANDFNVIGTTIKWYGATDGFITSFLTHNNPTPAALGVNTTTATSFSYQASQTSIKGCESPRIKVNAVIKDLPELTITSSVLDLTKICQSGGLITFNPSRPKATDLNTGTWGGSVGSAFIVINPTTGQLNPLALPSPDDTYTLTYTFVDQQSGCSNTLPLSLTVLPSVNPSLAISDACDGFFVDLTNTSTIIPPSATSVIDSIDWDFGDQSSLPSRPFGNTIPAGFSNVTKGTFGSPSHIFKSVGSFSVNYTMKTSDGCFVTGTKQVINHEVPRAAFAWINPCYDNGSADIQFAGANQNGNLTAGEIQSYTWDFAKNNSLSILSPGSGKNPVTTYSTTGRDSVQLIVTSIHNCKDTIQKPVFIVPSVPAITEDNSYSENFNVNSGGWIAGGTNSSWQHGAPNPANPTINRDSSATGTGQAWITNLTGNNNPNEQSWVLSPCYNFSIAQKPVISLDIWSDTPRQIDGAVLQYNDTDNIENNANWKVLGNIGQGVNWYDLQGIASKPGNQPAFDYGWSGDASFAKYKKGWIHTVFKLDELIGKPNVKLRIAFASNFGRQKGFAFDNIFIGERSRSVLIENFTNTSQPSVAAQNNHFNTYGNGSGEIVKLQFHTSFPGYDTLNKINAPMNNARAAFYGITTTPTLRIDGKSGTGVYTSWFDGLYDDRVLNPSPIKITIDTPVKTGEVVSITARITNTTSSALDLRNVNVFVVIAEKSITTAPWLGSSGNSEFTFVAKQMLPTPSGISIGRILNAGETFEVPEAIWNQRDLITSGNGVVVLYVQSLLNDKEVYQAKIVDNPAQPDVVTGVESLLDEHIKLYPNPANESVKIELAYGVQNRAVLKMFDVNGRELHKTAFEKGERIKIIETKELTGGVYLIQLNNGSSIIRKKLMVMHP